MPIQFREGFSEDMIFEPVHERRGIFSANGVPPKKQMGNEKNHTNIEVIREVELDRPTAT